MVVVLEKQAFATKAQCNVVVVDSMAKYHLLRELHEQTSQNGIADDVD